jgi:hypothetical protein
MFYIFSLALWPLGARAWVRHEWAMSRRAGISLVLVLGRQGFWCPALCQWSVRRRAFMCSHGPSLGWFGLPVIGHCFKRAALCVSCVPSCYLRASLNASSCMLHAPCLVPCALLCLSLLLGLLVSFVLSSAPLHFVVLALLVSRDSLSLSHSHWQFHARRHVRQRVFLNTLSSVSILLSALLRSASSADRRFFLSISAFSWSVFSFHIHFLFLLQTLNSCSLLNPAQGALLSHKHTFSRYEVLVAGFL